MAAIISWQIWFKCACLSGQLGLVVGLARAYGKGVHMPSPDSYQAEQSLHSWAWASSCYCIPLIYSWFTCTKESSCVSSRVTKYSTSQLWTKQHASFLAQKSVWLRLIFYLNEWVWNKLFVKGKQMKGSLALVRVNISLQGVASLPAMLLLCVMCQELNMLCNE